MGLDQYCTIGETVQLLGISYLQSNGSAPVNNEGDENAVKRGRVDAVPRLEFANVPLKLNLSEKISS